MQTYFQMTSNFQCCKNYDFATNVPYYDVAVNIVNSKSLMKKTLVPLRSNMTVTAQSMHNHAAAYTDYVFD